MKFKMDISYETQVSVRIVIWCLFALSPPWDVDRTPMFPPRGAASTHQCPQTTPERLCLFALKEAKLWTECPQQGSQVREKGNWFEAVFKGTSIPCLGLELTRGKSYKQMNVF